MAAFPHPFPVGQRLHPPGPSEFPSTRTAGRPWVRGTSLQAFPAKCLWDSRHRLPGPGPEPPAQGGGTGGSFEKPGAGSSQNAFDDHGRMEEKLYPNFTQPVRVVPSPKRALIR